MYFILHLFCGFYCDMETYDNGTYASVAWKCPVHGRILEERQLKPVWVELNGE